MNSFWKSLIIASLVFLASNLIPSEAAFSSIAFLVSLVSSALEGAFAFGSAFASTTGAFLGAGAGAGALAGAGATESLFPNTLYATNPAIATKTIIPKMFPWFISLMLCHSFLISHTY